MAYPLISVLVPVYNAEASLSFCVDSILAQSYPHFELVLVNDGSSDASGAICDAIAAQDARCRVIHQANSGSAAARNAALDAARGEYIAWVDSDDFIAPGFLTHLYGLCRSFDSGVGMCRFEEAQSYALPASPGKSVEPECFMDFESYITCLYSVREVEMVVLWNKLYLASLWQGIRFPLGSSIDDDPVVWQLVWAAGGLAVSTLPLYYYYTAGDSVMRGSGAALRRMDGLPFLQQRRDFLQQQGFALLACRTQLGWLLQALEISSQLGASAQEKAARKALRASWLSQWRIYAKNALASRRLALRLLAYHLCPPLFAHTSRNQIFFA